MTTNTSSDIGSATQTVGGYITSITGTSNQITASASTGAVTLSTPGVSLQYVKISPTATAIKAMRTTPIQVIAAAGANTLILPQETLIEHVRDGTAYAAGGSIRLQYDSTTLAGGVAASESVIADAITNATARFNYIAYTASSNTAGSTTVNKGIYLTNITAAFTTGTDTVNIYVWYVTISTTI
jgi:hypothetical protein